MLTFDRPFTRRKPAGLSPGTAVFVGEQRAAPPRLSVMDYSEAGVEEKPSVSVEECAAYQDKPTVTWINVTGVHDVPLIEAISRRFGLHPLTVEDIVNTTQRPKLEVFESYLFLVFKMLTYDAAREAVKVEQVSLVVASNCVISFQEVEGDVFEPVRERIRNGKGRIRRMGPDYLAHALMDAVVDEYFAILERVGDAVDALESTLLEAPPADSLARIQRLKRGVLFLRKSVWPLREEIAAIEKDESHLVRKETRPFLRDLYDHTIQVMESVETQRDMLSGMHDTYLSSVSNRMNEVMKVLTVIATLFIPLTFVVGVYGMNFEHMPELKWPWAYPAVWAVMVAIAVGMLLFFRVKKWI